MALRKIKFVEGESYHVYNRGNTKKIIFHDQQDYERFRNMLYLCNGTKRFHFKDLLKIEKDIYKFERGTNLVEIMAYVQMPNHFHLMLSIPSTISGPYVGVNKNLDNNLSIFIRRLTAAYSMYYNRKYSVTGSLLEGRFKAEHVGNDNYFKYLFSYIHLNPLKLIQSNWKEVGIKDYVEARKFLENFKHSSFSDYFLSPVPYGGIINKKSFLNRIPNNTNLNKEIFDWLNFKTIQ